MHVRTLVLLASFTLLLSLPASAGGPGWTGTWDSQTGAGNEYDFTFNQSGSTVTGYYVRGGQTEQIPITNGAVNGDVLTFESDDLYDYEFTMNADGDSYKGKWGYLTSPGAYSGGTYIGERRKPPAPSLGRIVAKLKPCSSDGTKEFNEFTVRRRGCRQWQLIAYLKGGDFAEKSTFAPDPYTIWLEDAMPGSSFDNVDGPSKCVFRNYPQRREGGKTCLLSEGTGSTRAGVDLGVHRDNRFKGTMRYRATIRKGAKAVKRSNVVEVVIKGSMKRRRG